MASGSAGHTVKTGIEGLPYARQSARLAKGGPSVHQTCCTAASWGRLAFRRSGILGGVVSTDDRLCVVREITHE